MKKPKAGDKVVFISPKHLNFLGQIGEVTEKLWRNEGDIIVDFGSVYVSFKKPYKEISRHTSLAKPLQAFARILQIWKKIWKKTRKEQAIATIGGILVTYGAYTIHTGLAIICIGAFLMTFGVKQ